MCENEHIFCRSCVTAWLGKSTTCPFDPSHEITLETLLPPPRLAEGLLDGLIRVETPPRESRQHMLNDRHRITCVAQQLEEAHDEQEELQKEIDRLKRSNAAFKANSTKVNCSIATFSYSELQCKAKIEQLEKECREKDRELLEYERKLKELNRHINGELDPRISTVGSPAETGSCSLSTGDANRKGGGDGQETDSGCKRRCTTDIGGDIIAPANNAIGPIRGYEGPFAQLPPSLSKDALDFIYKQVGSTPGEKVVFMIKYPDSASPNKSSL